MLSLDNTNRRRKRKRFRDVATTRSLQVEDDRLKTTDVPVICLTGLTPQEKDKYHTLIVQLGAR